MKIVSKVLFLFEQIHKNSKIDIEGDTKVSLNSSRGDRSCHLVHFKPNMP